MSVRGARGAGGCLGCGGALAVRFPAVVDPQTGERFRIEACGECGLGHTLPRPAELGPYYGPRYHGHRHGATDGYCSWRRSRLVRGACGEGAGRRLLDVGCGDGSFLLRARRAGFRVYGTELEPSLARAAGLEVRTGLDEVLGPFDCVTLWHSLEHLQDPAAALRRVRELVAPDGAVIVAVPDARSAQARLFGAGWFHLDVPRHLFHFGARSLEGMLRTAGFRAERVFHPEAEYDLLGWSQSALNRVVAGEPNAFFEALTGRSSGERSAARRWRQWTLGTALTALAVPAVAATLAAQSPGTLVMVGRPA